MLFHTPIFAAFFGLVWVGFWLLRRHDRARLILLTLASWGFYAAWDWRFLSLLLLSTAVDYVAARGMATGAAPARRRWVILSAAVNLGVLATFKYLDFFAGSAAAALRALGLEADWVSLQLVLPVGISFYTFQSLGYSLDVYRGRTTAETDPWRFAAYVAFFPQLVAGPIERAETLIPQLAGRPRFSAPEQVEGARRFVVGLWKKLVIADGLGVYVDWVFAAPVEQLAPHQVLLGTLAFAGQIWGDFSGYSDMAIGLARTLGVRLRENFDAPYLARGPQDFWRRWHISLSTWLRDYLYIPLGGSRRGPLRTRLNLLVTMLLGGLWHGAAWTFVVWGALHGLWLALARALPPRAARGDGPRWGPRDLLAVPLTFAIVTLGWLFFRAPDLGWALGALRALGAGIDPRTPALAVDLGHLGPALWWVLVMQLVQIRWGADAGPQAGSDPARSWPTGRVVLHLVALFALVSVLRAPPVQDHAPFIYFQF